LPRSDHGGRIVAVDLRQAAEVSDDLPMLADRGLGVPKMQPVDLQVAAVDDVGGSGANRGGDLRVVVVGESDAGSVIGAADRRTTGSRNAAREGDGVGAATDGAFVPCAVAASVR
jgi:hypothetical protein